MQTRWVSIVICDDPDGLNGYALRLEHVSAGRARVLFAPVQGPGVWMYPEEAPMPRSGSLTPSSFPGVFPQVLTNHRLCDSLYHSRICSWLHAFWIHQASTGIESVVNL